MMQNFDLDAPDLDTLGTFLAEKYDPKVGGQLQAWRSNASLTYNVLLVTEINKLPDGFERLPDNYMTTVSPSEIFTGYILLGKLMKFGCTVCARQFELTDLVILRLLLTDSALYNSVKWWETYFDNLEDFDGKILPDNTRLSLVHYKVCNGLRQIRSVL